jgi:predicted ester cyclase
VRIQTEEVIAEGDVVAARWSGTGTHRGTLRGFAATHTRARFAGMVFVHILDGKIVDGWDMFNEADMMQQLGAAPAAE